MEIAIEIFAMINFLIMGLSHVFQHRAWADFFILLSRQGYAGVFANGFLTLLIGSLIVSFHNVWTGIPMVLTLVGWGLVIKGAVVFLLPEWGLRSISRVEKADSRYFCVAGFLLIAMALLQGISLWQRAV